MLIVFCFCSEAEAKTQLDAIFAEADADKSGKISLNVRSLQLNRERLVRLSVRVQNPRAGAGQVVLPQEQRAGRQEGSLCFALASLLTILVFATWR